MCVSVCVWTQSLGSLLSSARELWRQNLRDGEGTGPRPQNPEPLLLKQLIRESLPLASPREQVWAVLSGKNNVVIASPFPGVSKSKWLRVPQTRRCCEFIYEPVMQISWIFSFLDLGTSPLGSYLSLNLISPKIQLDQSLSNASPSIF